MAIEVLTKEDLNQFKTELLSAISQLVIANPQNKQKWLKSKEVLELLTMSPGTLQNLRINGTLTFTKIGGTKTAAKPTILFLVSRIVPSFKA